MKAIVEVHFNNGETIKEAVEWDGVNYPKLTKTLLKKHKGSVDIAFIEFQQ